MTLATQPDIQDCDLFAEAMALAERRYAPGTGTAVAPGEDIAVAPDGTRLAWSATVFDRMEGGGRLALFVAKADGSGAKTLSSGPHSDQAPVFSPDGTRLGFLSDRSSQGDFQFCLLDLASGAVSQTARPEGWVEYFAFSPDGTRVLLGVAGHGADIAGGAGAKTSARSDSKDLPDWAPRVETGDESFRRRSVWLLDLENDGVQQVSPANWNVWEACWCGSSAWAAVVSEGASEADWYGAQVRRFDLASGQEREIFTPQLELGNLVASPSGQRLAVCQAPCSDRGICAGQVTLCDLESGINRTLDTLGVDVACVQFRGEDRLLASGIRRFSSVVLELDLADGSVREWLDAPELGGVGRYPRASVDPSRDDGFFVALQGFSVAAQILSGDGQEFQVAVDFAHAGSREAAELMATVEPWTWIAPDGHEVLGWVRRGHSPNAPLLMDVHGGPIWNTQPAFTRGVHLLMLVQRGYALFWPNPRGSTGQGIEWAGEVVGDMGGADTQDYLSGLDSLVSAGIADPRRIAVTGGSYGGFMSSWLITQDSRFAAAVPVAPVTDWISQHLTSNIPSFDDYCLASTYTDVSGRHVSRSPIMFADRVRTPTLNICGSLDRCTPPGQAREFHNALLENGVHSGLVEYPQEGHGVRAWPAAADYSARLVAWLLEHV